MNKLIINLIAFITLSLPIGAFAAEIGKCIYPSPDGGGPEPSPPTVKGKIIQVEPNTIILKIESNLKSKTLQHKRIRIDHKTQIFTYFGGYVGRSELAAGQAAAIWYVGCKVPKKGQQPYAAVVEIDSTKDEKDIH